MLKSVVLKDLENDGYIEFSHYERHGLPPAVEILLRDDFGGAIVIVDAEKLLTDLKLFLGGGKGESATTYASTGSGT